MQIIPPIGAELSSKLKCPYLKDYYRFYFLPIFYKWSLDNAKEISFQNASVETYLKAWVFYNRKVAYDVAHFAPKKVADQQL